MQNILIALAALPGLFGFVCLIRRGLNARKAAEWVKNCREEEWNSLNRFVRRHPWLRLRP